MKRYIGVDVGGTFVKAGLFENKKMMSFIEEQTAKNGRKVIEQIVGMVEVLQQGQGSLRGVGVGIPGPLDLRGVWKSAPNIPQVSNIPILRILEKRLGTRVVIENDAACAALAEARARNIVEMVYVNLGTGVGVGIILRGRIFHLSSGNPEAGHLIHGEGRKCGAGHVGCWEAFSSGSAILNIAQEKGLPEDMKTLVEKASKGDKKALELFASSGVYLGKGIASLANIFRIPFFVLGGSVAEAYLFMKKEMMKELRTGAFDVPRISLKKLRYPGVMGARMLVE